MEETAAQDREDGESGASSPMVSRSNSFSEESAYLVSLTREVVAARAALIPREPGCTAKGPSVGGRSPDSVEEQEEAEGSVEPSEEPSYDEFVR